MHEYGGFIALYGEEKNTYNNASLYVNCALKYKQDIKYKLSYKASPQELMQTTYRPDLLWHIYYKHTHKSWNYGGIQLSVFFKLILVILIR